jgi:hypothetical protein
LLYASSVMLLKSEGFMFYRRTQPSTTQRTAPVNGCVPTISLHHQTKDLPLSMLSSAGVFTTPIHSDLTNANMAQAQPNNGRFFNPYPDFLPPQAVAYNALHRIAATVHSHATGFLMSPYPGMKKDAAIAAQAQAMLKKIDPYHGQAADLIAVVRVLKQASDTGLSRLTSNWNGDTTMRNELIEIENRLAPPTR